MVKMHYFIYLSLAIKAMSQAELAKLIEECRVNNAQNELTGLLMYKGPLSSGGDAYFTQVLEGPSTQLEQLKEKIKSDPRHTNFVMLQEGQTESRTFPKWSMGLRHVDEHKLCHLKGYENLGSQEFWASAQNRELENWFDMMKFFYDVDV